MGARSQLQRFLAEVGRFMLVGGAATLAAFVLFNVLAHGLVVGEPLLPDRPLTAFVLANTVGMLVSYHGSRTYVFRDRAATGADGGFAAYVVINAATMTLPIACLWVSRTVLGLDDAFSDNVAANGIGLVLGLGARFHLFRTLVFRRPISLVEIYDEPDAPAHVDVVRAATAPSGRSTATSTTDPDGAPGAAAAAG